MSKILDKYVGKSVLIQLRAQPFYAVTGASGPAQPIVDENKNFLHSPILTGIVTEMSDGYLEIEHPDPIGKGGSVLTLLNCELDVAYISLAKEGSRILTPSS